MKKLLCIMLAGFLLVASPALAVVTAEATLLNNVVSTGASIAVGVANSGQKTFLIKATNVTDGGTIAIETSIDNVHWVAISTTSITANGNTEVAVNGFLHKFIRVNLTARADGTYTVKYIQGNV